MTVFENWGATDEERTVPLPCDELLASAPVRVHRAVSVHARPAVVFRRLCQLRLAPYSYDLIDNLGRRSPRELIEGAEHLEVGQRFMMIFSLASFTQDEQITLRNSRTAVTYALRTDGEGPTRLLARLLFDPPGSYVGATILGNALSMGDLVMMRKQLLTLKGLAEQDAGSPAWT